MTTTARPQPTTTADKVAAAHDTLIDLVAGYRTWRGLGRQVMRGQQGHVILCPRMRVVRDTAFDGANGVTNVTTRLVQVRTDIDDAAQVKTLAHELGHSLLHDPARTGTDPRDLHRGSWRSRPNPSPTSSVPPMAWTPPATPCPPTTGSAGNPVLTVAVGMTVAIVAAWRRSERRRRANPRLLHGVATTPEVRAAAGLREVRRRARHARRLAAASPGVGWIRPSFSRWTRSATSPPCRHCPR